MTETETMANPTPDDKDAKRRTTTFVSEVLERSLFWRFHYVHGYLCHNQTASDVRQTLHLPVMFMTAILLHNVSSFKHSSVH